MFSTESPADFGDRPYQHVVCTAYEVKVTDENWRNLIDRILFRTTASWWAHEYDHEGTENMRILVIATAAVAFAGSPAMASGRATCPGAAATPNGPPAGIGIIATKSTDMEGSVFARGATRCTIKFQDVHKTAPYCSISGVVEYHVSAKVLRTSSSEVTFTFDPSLLSEIFNYSCLFRD